ncbi:MAG: UTP--glucose-1-phosphate uridylyltransferase GalU [Caldisericia bacterium]
MKINKAVIPLGGLGTRLLPITKSQPKEMLPIYDRPAIHYAVLEAKKSGIENFLFITGRGKESIENYFDYSFELEERLKKDKKFEYLEKVQEIYNLGKFFYIRQKEPKGLGDAIYLSKDFVNTEPFVVILADDIFIYNEPPIKKLIEIFYKYNGIILGIKKVPFDKVERYGIIKGEKIKNNLYKVSDLIEKPKREEAPSNFAIIGRYVLLPQIFDVLKNLKPGKNNEIQLTDAIKELIDKVPIFGYEIDDKHFDIGDKLDFILANVYFASMDKEIKKELLNKIEDLIKKEKGVILK